MSSRVVRVPVTEEGFAALCETGELLDLYDGDKELECITPFRIPVSDTGLEHMVETGGLVSLYGGDKELAKKLPPRISVDNESFVLSLQSGKLKKLGGHEDDIEQQFYKNYIRLIQSYVAKNEKAQFNNEEEDVVQKCFHSLRNKVNHYKRSRGSWSNFTFYVCRSVMSSHWKKQNRHDSRMVDIATEDDDFRHENTSDHCEDAPSHIGEQIRKAVVKLMEAYPAKHDVIMAIFEGDPRHESYQLPVGGINSWATISRRLGCHYNQVHTFWKKHAMPFLQEAIKEESE